MIDKPRFRQTEIEGQTAWVQTGGPEIIGIDELPDASASVNGSVSGIGHSPARFNVHDGDKFPGGFGPTELFLTDYWTLRQRSTQLFENNAYARGLIRRLVTNVINTGLAPEAFPEESILGYEDGELDNWAETTENRFRIWANNPSLCDYQRQHTFWQLQQIEYIEALIEGDVLVIMRQDQRTRLPNIQIVPGGLVRTPMGEGRTKPRQGNEIVEGVELDSHGRHVAYHFVDSDGAARRIPAVGERSGRRIAWLKYGTEKRHNHVRGQPMLSLVLQSMKELDRYRDAAQRKAVINSMLAMFIKKDADKPGSQPLTSAGTRRDKIIEQSTGRDERQFDMVGQIPGLVMEELQTGETPQAYGMDGTDINFPAFESAIVQALAWSNEVPPEILQLAFSNNYSASQAAINEMKMFLNRVRKGEGADFCQPIYVDWLLSETLLQKIDAPGLVRSFRDPQQYDVFGAWTSTDWTGAIKPSTDLVKQAKGQKLLLDQGLTTHSRATSEVTGMSFNRNIKRLRREHQQKAEAWRPIKEFEREFGEMPGGDPGTGDGEGVADNPNAMDEDRIVELVDERLEDSQ